MAPLLPLDPRVLEYSVPKEKHWANPTCQNSEPTKRTVSIWAIDKYYNYTELQTDHFTMGQILAEIMIICFLSTYVNEN